MPARTDGSRQGHAAPAPHLQLGVKQMCGGSSSASFCPVNAGIISTRPLGIWAPRSSPAGLARKSRAALSFPSTKQPGNNEDYLGSTASKSISLLYMERGEDAEEGRGDPGWKAVQGAWWQQDDAGAKDISLLGGLRAEQSSPCATQAMRWMPVVLVQDSTWPLRPGAGQCLGHPCCLSA